MIFMKYMKYLGALLIFLSLSNLAFSFDDSDKAKELHKSAACLKAKIDDLKFDSAAQACAAKALNLAKEYINNWNAGNAIHDANLVLGMDALSQKKTSEASAFLIRSAEINGSPQLNSFGPNMVLAKSLIEKGEQAAVLKYFALCKKFWKEDHGKLALWTTQVQKGLTPDFGANLHY